MDHPKDDERIKTVQDLKGKKLGYSSPKSVTDMITTMMLDDNGLTGQVERRSVGGIGAGVDGAARGRRRHDLRDPAGVGEGEGKFPPVFNSGRLGAARDADRRRGEDRLPEEEPGSDPRHHQARRKGVEFIKANPDESAADHGEGVQDRAGRGEGGDRRYPGRSKGVYWSPGDFDYEGMETMLKGLQLVKAIEPGPVRLVEGRRRELSAGGSEAQAASRSIGVGRA